jgi:uncharacterized protein YggE
LKAAFAEAREGEPTPVESGTQSVEATVTVSFSLA